MLEHLIGQARRLATTTARHGWLALATVGLTSIGCALALSQWTDRHEARARVYVDTQSVLKPMMAGLTYQPDVDQQVGMLARTLVSRPNIEKLVDEPDLRLHDGSAEAREAAVGRLMKQIRINPGPGSNLYDVVYRDADAPRAQRVVEDMVQLFVRVAAGDKRRDAQEAGRFIEAQIQAYEAKLVAAEETLKEFRIRNFGVTGVSDQDYFARVSAQSEQVAVLQAELQAAQKSRDAYRRELANEDPQLPVDPLLRAGGAAVSEPVSRLLAQRRTVDELLTRYTEAHPDVIAARRVLVDLEAEARAPVTVSTSGIPGGRAATSPVYQRLRISLAEAEAQVASLASQLATRQAQLTQVRQLANRAPQVEAEHAQLNRDYDVIRKNYESLVARRESAALGAKLDESTQLATFRVVEPPRVSPKPVFPSRLLLTVGAVLLSLGAGLAVAQLADRMTPVVHDLSQLREICERPLLGLVPVITTPARRHHQRALQWRYRAAFGALLFTQAGWLAWTALQ
jgi:polysaccharide chain length determinant protein (PEP-CTERM system associated)